MGNLSTFELILVTVGVVVILGFAIRTVKGIFKSK